MVPLVAWAQAVPAMPRATDPMAMARALRWKRLLRCDLRRGLLFMLGTPQWVIHGYGELAGAESAVVPMFFAASRRTRHANAKPARGQQHEAHERRKRCRATPRSTLRSILTSRQRPPMKRQTHGIAAGYGFVACGHGRNVLKPAVCCAFRRAQSPQQACAAACSVCFGTAVSRGTISDHEHRATASVRAAR